MSTQLPLETEIEIELALAQLAAKDGSAIPFEPGEGDTVAVPLWKPHPSNKPQCQAYYSPADITGYGGAAHGGKSDLLLGLAVTKHHVTKIFRREHAQLKDLIDRAREIIPGEYMNLNGVCRMPDGRRITLLGVKNVRDITKHKGRPADLFGFDEATEFTEEQIRFLLGWNRTVIPGQRCRGVLCFNPPTTPEGRWVLNFFGPWLLDGHPHPAEPGELRWYAGTKEGEEIEVESGETFSHHGEILIPRSRTFIPARPTDNPFTDEAYIAVLQSLPGPLRAQMLYGDFRAGLKDDPWQIIPTEDVKLAQKRWVDLKGHRPTGSYLDAIGVDVSRGGQDQTVLAPRYRNFFGLLEVFQGREVDDGPKVAALVARMCATEAPGRPQPDINIDAIGVGTSPYDALIANDFVVNAINNGEGADPEARDKSGRLGFANIRAQYLWAFREMLDPANGHDIALPPDPELLTDLTSYRWKLTVRGIQAELKAETSKRIGRSPDRGDAIINAAILRAPIEKIGKPAVAGKRHTSNFKMI